MNEHVQYSPSLEGKETSRKLNVLGTELLPCDGLIDVPTNPETSFICGVASETFLVFLHSQKVIDQNRALPNGQILHPGAKYCMNTPIWYAAHQVGCAPSVILEATPENLLVNIPADILIAIAENCELYD